MKRKYISNKIRATLQKEIMSKCPFCNSEDVEHFEVHHIDWNTENNEINNLVLLCPTCHSKIGKNDILLSKVKEVKAGLLKTKAKFSVLEIAELEHGKAVRMRLREEYLRSSKANDDIILEANSLFRIFQKKCDEIKNKLKTHWIDCQKTSESNLKISLSHIYILVQFYPHFEEYKLSCTFNENEILGRGNQQYKFIIKRYLFDMDDLGNLGWKENSKFYSSEELAEFLLKKLFEINHKYM